MSCPICGCRNGRHKVVEENRLGIGGAFSYEVCARCRLVRLLSPPEDMAFYYENYSYHRKHGAVDRRHGVCRALSRLLMIPLERYHPVGTDLDVFDIGCATGAYLKELREMGVRRVKGLEPSAKAVQNKVDENLDIVCAPFEEFETGETFDLVTLNGVFEHFERPREVLLKLKGLLKDDGKLVMAFPNYSSFARMVFGSVWPGYDAPRHYYTFNSRNIRLLCSQCGLKVVKVRHISRPSQFLGAFQYISNRLTRRRTRLEEGFFRSSAFLDLLFFPAAYFLNFLRLGDMIEVHVVKEPAGAGS